MALLVCSIATMISSSTSVAAVSAEGMLSNIVYCQTGLNHGVLLFLQKLLPAGHISMILIACTRVCPIQAKQLLNVGA